MPWNELLDEEEEYTIPMPEMGEPKPVDRLSNRVPAFDPMVQSKIAERMGLQSNDPILQQYEQDQSEIGEALDLRMGMDRAANIGMIAQQAARGSAAPVENDMLAKSLASQSGDLLKSKTGDLDRRQKMMAAIESRKLREATQANTQAYRQAQLGMVNQKIDEKRNDRELSLTVPGYERTGQVLPKPEEAMKFRKATASAEQLKGKLNRLRDLVKDVGAFELGGQRGQEMESLATEIQLLSKNEEMYNLGVLTGPDMALLTKITADPASMASFFTWDSTRQKQIDTQLKSIEDKLAASAKSMGYQRGGMTAGNESTFPKQLRKDGKVVTVSNQNEMDEAQNEGWM